MTIARPPISRRTEPPVPGSDYRRSPGWKAFNTVTRRIDMARPWHRLPLPAALAVLVGIRNTLRQSNLFDTSAAPAEGGAQPSPWDARYRSARSPDGSHNDLDHPGMGMAGARFGRNVPHAKTWPEPEPALMEPSPRTVSRELLTRHTFQPAETLNVLAAAWLQFMIRDWFSHGTSPTDNPWRVPISDDDDWHERPMTIMRTPPDPTRAPGEVGHPPTYVNHETHWWDGSQLYGSSREAQERLRSHQHGKLHVRPDGRLPLPDDPRANPAHVPGFWLGLHLLGTLFVLEHNAICDRLRAEYPTWDDDELFERARLINAALLAKIHTVEWTPAVISHPATEIGMRANWWGLLGERAYRMFGYVTSSEVLAGIPSTDVAHYGVPYSLTEEFVAVYRMHPLIPDDWVLRSAADDSELARLRFREITGPQSETLVDGHSLTDLLYSFGRMHPGAIRLHNFPQDLQRFTRPDGTVVDLGAVDILRSRELGVPRYNEFRRLLHLPPARSFEELTDEPAWREELRRVYGGDVERVDLTVGMFAEPLPQGFAFSDTAFRIFVLMASRRLNSDRFFTTDYTPDVYTPAGMRWIDDSTMSTVLLRHHPELRPALQGVSNAFAPWRSTGPAVG